MADRGMVSPKIIEELEDRGVQYIVGVRMRKDKEVRELELVLSHPGRYQEVEENLKVKEVKIEGRRYIVCLNPKEAEKDARDRELLLETLKEKLSQGAKALVGNRGFRRYLKVGREGSGEDRPQEGG